MKPNPTTQPLSHLTALHMLGRLFERIDQHQQAPHAAGCNRPQAGCHRYECAMKCLSRSLDEIEQRFMLREVLSQHTGYRHQ
jgi:hypothetical protein